MWIPPAQVEFLKQGPRDSSLWHLIDGFGTERQIGFGKVADSPKLKGIYFSCGRNWVTLRSSSGRESPVKGTSALSWELRHWKQGREGLNLPLKSLM